MGVSVIIPCFKRIEQTLITLQHIFSSDFSTFDAPLEVILADSSPDDALEQAVQKACGDGIVYTRPEKPGIATNKNHGAKIATGDIIIFCDSDIEVEKHTLSHTVQSLQRHATAAALGGSVVWKGGAHDGAFDRPRPEDRMITKEGTTYTEAIYSRYMATYKKVFWQVGGYDEQLFNMRGEGSDLSIRYWRSGYPLIYEKDIVTHHVHDVPDSAALRVADPMSGIAQDLVLLALKYDMVKRRYPNFEKTVAANFGTYSGEDGMQFLTSLAGNTERVVKAKTYLAHIPMSSAVYDFKFLEVLSDEKLFDECIAHAKERLMSVKAL